MIKISIDRPQLRDGGTLEHSGTSWQISRIPNFEDRSYYLAESLNDGINLLEFRHTVELESSEALYCRVKYHSPKANTFPCFRIIGKIIRRSKSWRGGINLCWGLSTYH